MTANSQRKVVLLFYKDFERDSFVKYDHYVKRVLRPIYSRLGRRPAVTGFKMWFDLLALSLTREGCDVRVNDYKYARAHPDVPVGLVGYPQLLDGWDLPNPAVLGPSLFDHPGCAPDLMNDPRCRYYLVTCEWMHQLFATRYGDACVEWYAGIDTSVWADTASERKDVDVLVYDKVRWNRSTLVPGFIEPMLATMHDRGLRTEVLRYGEHNHHMYAAALRRSRSMLFLCEHETQGMAYMEAMASNVPVLAWDNGWWLDPQRERYQTEPVPASSVPYFDETCGERFRDLAEFPDALSRFVDGMDGYAPRKFVQEHLSLSGSAQRYLSFYDALRSP